MGANYDRRTAETETPVTYFRSEVSPAWAAVDKASKAYEKALDTARKLLGDMARRDGTVNEDVAQVVGELYEIARGEHDHIQAIRNRMFSRVKFDIPEGLARLPTSRQ